MTSAAEFQAKVEKTSTNMDRLDGIVNGGPDAVIQTDNGPVPSMAKAIGDFSDSVDDILGDIGDIADAVAAAEAAAELAQAQTKSSFGNFIDRLRPFGSEASNGASLVGDTAVSIPSGSTGAGSYVRPRWEKNLTGLPANTTVTLKLEVTKSATFTRNLQAIFQVSTPTNLFDTRMDSSTTTVTSVTNGDKIVYTFVYLVQGDEVALQPYVQIATSPTATSNEDFEVTGISFAFSTIDDSFAPASDQNTELLKSDILERVSDIYQGGTGNIIDRLPDFGQAVANGATFTGKFEISVASGQTGAGSFIRPRWEYSFADYVGAEIEVKLRVLKSATFTRELVPTFQISTSVNPFVGRNAALSIANDGDKTVYTYRYTVQGDEVAINPYVTINPGQTDTTASVEKFELNGFAGEFVSNPDRFTTPADANIEMVKDEVVSEARKITLLRPTFADTITVKASGGDFTTISDAIAAIRDASVRRQWKIAWSAGAQLGTPDFHIPAFTAIVCQDRTEDAILSFTNPNDASASIITNTSLAWIDADGVVIDGGTWRIKNGRYVFHWETNGNFPDTQQPLVGVHADHLGNAEAVNNAWGVASQVALGIGVSGGQILDIQDCILRGPGGGWLAHSPANLDWTEPFEINFLRSRAEATDPTCKDIIIKPIRRGPGKINLVESSFDEVSYIDSEWIGGNPGSGVNTAQIAVTEVDCTNLDGNGPPAFVNEINFGSAAGKDYRWFQPAFKGSEKDVLFKRKFETELAQYSATLKAAVTTYGYNYIYMQAFAVDEARKEIVVLHCPDGGANKYSWFTVWDVSKPESPTVKVTFYYPTTEWRESVILRTIGGVRYLEFLDNFTLVRVNLNTLPADGSVVSSTATFAIDCFPMVTYDPVSNIYLAGNRANGAGGRAVKDRYYWRSGDDPMVITGEYRLPFLAAGSNRTGYIDNLAKMQGIALHKGQVVTGHGGVTGATTDSAPRACGLMVSSLDGNLIDTALAKQSGSRDLFGEMTNRTVSLVESEGVYSTGGKLYQLWATLTGAERDGALGLERGIVITSEMDSGGVDFSPHAFVPDKTLSKERFQSIIHTSSTQLTNPWNGGTALNSVGDIVDMMSDASLDIYKFYGTNQTLTDIAGNAFAVSGCIVTFDLSGGVVCEVTITGNERWGRYWITDLNGTRAQATVGAQVTSGGNWWIGADNANNAINQVAGHRLQKDGTIISYRGGAGGATQYLGRSGDGGLVSYYRDGAYAGGLVADAYGIQVVAKTGGRVLVLTAVRNITTGASYSVAPDDEVIVVNKTTGSATGIALPSSPANGRRITVKDGKGDAATNNITVTPATGTIDGAANFVISTNRGRVTLLYSGTEWVVL